MSVGGFVVASLFCSDTKVQSGLAWIVKLSLIDGLDKSLDQQRIEDAKKK